jgi:hypothetical protein
MGSDASDLGFELVPPTDDELSPEYDLAAAAAGALDDGLSPVPDDEPPGEPTGYSWAFDWSAGRFARQGSSPARVSGLDAVAERCMMALNSARYAHPVFSDEFGTEQPQRGIGTTGQEAREAADDWTVAVRDALLVIDEVTDVHVSPEYDPIEGAIFLRDLSVTTNEDVVLPFPDIRIDFTLGG